MKTKRKQMKYIGNQWKPAENKLNTIETNENQKKTNEKQ